MPVQLTITGEDGIHAAAQLGQFISAILSSNTKPAPAAPVEPLAVESEAKKPAKRAKTAPVVEDDEDDVPAPKAKAKKPVVVEDDEDEEDEAPKPKAKAKVEAKPASTELKDDGKDQPATVEGCRIMVRRVAKATGCGTEYAQAVLAEFGVDGATKVPPKKMQAFIDRCQEVIDEPESIEVDEAE